MKITDDIRYIGVNDHDTDLFEGQYCVPNGASYNSYIIVDEKIAVLDTVDRNFTHEWLDNLERELGERIPDYLIVQHMEPDHSANIISFMNLYRNATVVASEKAFSMMKNFFGTDFENRRIIVKEGDRLALGRHVLAFVSAAMMHWPEVMVTYDYGDKVLFSADGFGKFGALDVQEDWIDEARRYYFGIVGKYGEQVQALLAKAKQVDISIICPLHGQVLIGNIGYYLGLYNTWSAYNSETDGVMIAYTSVYGNTKKAVGILADKLKAKGCPEVAVYDLARTDIIKVVSEAFRFRKLVFATITFNSEVRPFIDGLIEYDADIFPFMREFIKHLTERGLRNKTIGMIENGSWSPRAISVMKKMLEESEDITYTKNNVRILSAVSEENLEQIDALADELCMDYQIEGEEITYGHDLTSLFNISSGLYLVTVNDGKKDNGLIVNTVLRITDNPNRIAVCIIKDNYSHHVIKHTGKMNLCCLSVDAPLRVFENFGFRSGRNEDKFAGYDVLRSENGLVYPTKYINSYMSLKAEQYIDLEERGMFICSVTGAKVISCKETMSYTYYQSHLKSSI